MHDAKRATPPASFSLEVPACARYLAVVRDFAEEIARSAGLSPFDCHAVELAVDEACRSTIAQSLDGGCPPDRDGEGPFVSVRFRVADRQLQVEILDQGRGLSVSEPSALTSQQAVSTNDPSVIGLFVAARLMDGMVYTRATPAGHRLLLTKRL